jgi:peptide/nickel transport system ATP-binding protein
VSAAPLLEVQDLRVEFPTRRGTLVAVDGVSFSIAPGEVLGVVGESGAGKSLTGMAIIGLLEPPGRIAAGEIRLEGERIDNLRGERMRRIRGRRIGAIFQDPLTSLNPLYTVGEQLVETILAHLDVSRDEAQRRTLRLLSEVGIPAPEARIGHYPHQFSGGMRQRVVIALALCAEPRLIVADEPTTALDVSIQAQIIDLLKRLARDHGTAVMLITHDMGVIAETADRVAVMYAGRLAELGRRVAMREQLVEHQRLAGALVVAPGLHARLDLLVRGTLAHQPDELAVYTRLIRAAAARLVFAGQRLVVLGRLFDLAHTGALSCAAALEYRTPRPSPSRRERGSRTQAATRSAGGTMSERSRAWRRAGAGAGPGSASLTMRRATLPSCRPKLPVL